MRFTCSWAMGISREFTRTHWSIGSEKPCLLVEQQHSISVYDEDGTPIGGYVADLLVCGTILIELKAARELAREHEAQLLGYLKATRLNHGMLINFGAYRFQVRKFVRRG